MDDKQRRERIVNYLKIKPLNHGQIYTFQIAIPPSENVDISFERREYLKMSLTQQGTNLIPLIVRRTEAYSEEEEYELVYGADWCQAAKELDIEKLWVWVFDMTDEEVSTTKEEMQYLLGSDQTLSTNLTTETTGVGARENIVQTASSKWEEELVKKINDLSSQVKFVNHKCEQLINFSKTQHEIIDDLNPTISSLSQKISQLQNIVNQQEKLDCDRIADLVFTKLENVVAIKKSRQSKSQSEKKLKKEELRKLRYEDFLKLVDTEELKIFTNAELREIAKKQGIKTGTEWNRSKIIDAMKKSR